MPHGLLQEIEQDLEALALAASSGGGQQRYMQPPMQYGAGGMAYAPTMGIGMQYQQPIYGIQQRQMYAAAPMAPYGQAYVDPGTVVFGGPNEVMRAMPSGYPQAYPAQYQQAYAQPAQQQMYMQAPPPGYQQSYGQATQGPPAQTYAGIPQASPQAPLQQSYAPAPQLQAPPAQSYAPIPQPPQAQTYIAPYQAPNQQSYAPAAQSTPQPATYPASPQPPQAQVYAAAAQVPPLGPSQQSSPAPQPSLQPAISPQPSNSPVPQSQPLPPQNYALATQPSPQPTYPAGSQPPPQQSYQHAPQMAAPPAYLAVTSVQQQPIPGNPQAQYQAVYTTAGLLPITRAVQTYSSYLNPQDTMVRFTPTSAKVDTHHHALKALANSSHSAEALSAILGSYLALKHSHKDSHIHSIYNRSRPEVQTYNNIMDKLESLSADYIAKHKSVPPGWTAAMGPHRRHVFSGLFNKNELVRAFAQEMAGGPMMLPEVDTYALGTTRTLSNFSQSAIRPPLMNSSLSTLSQVRTVVLVDDSGSMNEPGHTSWGFFNRSYPESRWTQARNLLAGLAPLVAMHNPHGIDLHFLNRVPFYAGLRTSQAVTSAFDSDYPSNGTPTGQCVNDILDSYMSTLRYYRGLMPLNLIVITDGEAQDEETLHWTIEHHVTKIVHRGFPAHQFGVEFVQVGDCEFATRHLEKLEKEVSRHHRRFQRDVVGVTPTTRISDMNPEKLMAIAVSGIDARLNGYMRQRGINV